MDKTLLQKEIQKLKAEFIATKNKHLRLKLLKLIQEKEDALNKLM